MHTLGFEFLYNLWSALLGSDTPLTTLSLRFACLSRSLLPSSSTAFASCNRGQRPWVSVLDLFFISPACDACVWYLCVLRVYCRSVHACGCALRAWLVRWTTELSLSWPTFCLDSPQLAPIERTRSNASHSSRFHVITAFPCNHSWAFATFSLLCFDTEQAYRNSPILRLRGCSSVCAVHVRILLLCSTQ